MSINEVSGTAGEADDSQRREPKEVLYATMNFYDAKARKIATKILTALRNSEKADSQTMAMMFKAMVDADKLCVDTAAKLAPYIHPRLESVTSKVEVEHRYVIEAPSAESDPASWLSIALKQREELDRLKLTHKPIEEATIMESTSGPSN